MLIMLVATGVVFGGIFGMKAMGRIGMNAYFDNMPTPAATIPTVRAARMEWPNELLSVGSVVPFNGTDVTNEAEGIVRAVHFEPGQAVEAGTLLVSLESATERAVLHQLEAEAELAAAGLRRAKDLYRRQTISRAEYDEVIARASAARAAADAQRARLDQKQIRAPFAGVLGIRRVNVGQYLSKGTAIVSLQALDPIEVEFGLPERQQSQVAPGLPIRVHVDAWPGQVFEGTLSVVEPRVEAGTRNFRMRGRLANPDGKLRAGMFARVDILRPGNTEVVAIPRTALQYDSFGTSVFLVTSAAEQADRQIVQQRFIRIGAARGDYVAVEEGLTEGDEVAAGGLLKLRSGQPVKIDNSLLPDNRLEPAPADS